MPHSPTSPTALVDQVLAVQASQDERDRAFFALTATERVAAMWRTLQRPADTQPEVNSRTLYRWAQRLPHEVPLIDGEYAFIAALTPEVADRPTP